MASTNSSFADPERNKSLPPIPPSFSITRASGTMGPQPVTPRQLTPKLSVENPFADPLKETNSNSASPATAHLPKMLSSISGSTPRGNHSQNGTTTRDFTSATASDFLTADPKPSSSKSTASTVPSSSRTGTTTLISSNYGGAKSTTTDRNPFADPRSPARGQDHGHADRSSGPSMPLPRSTGTLVYSQYTTPGVRNHYLGPAPSINSSIAPTPPPKSPLRRMGPLGSNRWNSITAVRERISLSLHPEGSNSVNSLAIQAVALESAHRQDALLAIERAKANNLQPNLSEPHLRPSPSAVRLAAELHNARDAKDVYHSHAVLTSTPFWVAVVWVQCGLVSTTAAVTVVLEERMNGNKAKMGNGRVFWLTGSIIVIVVGIGVAFTIWMRKKGSFGGDQAFLRRLGFDEVGLLDRVVGRDLEMGRMEAAGDRESEHGEIGNAPSPQGTVRHRPRGSMPRADSLSSVRSSDTLWPAMYPHPRELKKMVSWETIGDTPVRRGAYGLHKDSNLARNYDEQRSKSALRKVQPQQKNQQLTSSSRRQKTESQHFIGPNRPHDSQGQRAGVSRRQVEFEKPKPTRSDISWPLQSSPNAQPFVNIHPEYPSYQDHPPTSYQGLQRQYPTKPYPSNYVAFSPSAGPFADSNDLKTEPHNRSRTGTESRVEVLSPLSSLTRIVHAASQSSLPPQHHPEYIHGHRVASEERVRSLRQSLDQSHSRSHSTSRELSPDQLNTPSAATERLREYVSEIEGESDEEERVGRPRSRSVCAVLESNSDLEGSVKHAVEERAGEDRHHNKGGNILTNGRGHVQVKEQPRCRSMGEVVREKIGKLKEAGVESDPEPAIPPKSPLRERDIFIVGDDTPSKTPMKTSRGSPVDSPGQTPIKTPNNGLTPSPLSRKD
ncbi:hypothetical protein BKA64DRAFT_224037 [Cadophora sp. MPI-SDFR-AT-0126]|nr:hypothetical protein BKA64DRAFT_224037 [Leotiomycetes sp. MPI-SDFR-AT-0126]